MRLLKAGAATVVFSVRTNDEGRLAAPFVRCQQNKAQNKDTHYSVGRCYRSP
jgi:hypothetical protein